MSRIGENYMFWKKLIIKLKKYKIQSFWNSKINIYIFFNTENTTKTSQISPEVWPLPVVVGLVWNDYPKDPQITPNGVVYWRPR